MLRKLGGILGFTILMFFLFIGFQNCGGGVNFGKAPTVVPPATTSPDPGGTGVNPSPGSPGPSPSPRSCVDTSVPGPKVSGQLCACDCECGACLYMSDDCNMCPNGANIYECDHINHPGRTYRYCI